MIQNIPFGDVTRTPILTRVLCDRIVDCFGFAKMTPADISGTLSILIIKNLASFTAVALGQDIWSLTAFTMKIFSGRLIRIPMFAYIPAAHLMIKCACDLIIILEQVCKARGKAALPKDVKLAVYGYLSKDSQGERKISIRKMVHEDIKSGFSSNSNLTRT